VSPANPAYARIIAHRGGGALAPENTLAGIRLAARLGCRGVEFDVMLSGDGVPMLMHDETLERTVDAQGRLADFPAQALRRFDAGLRHGPAFRGERIPTLAAALDLCAELRLWCNIEIKPARGEDNATAAAVATELLRRPLLAGVVSSFSMAALHEFAGRAPTLPRALLVEEIPNDWRARMTQVKARALHVAATADTLADVVAAGVPVACYTVNTRDEIAALLTRGVTAVFTDRPDLWTPEEYRV
jgi:glycerophosphoryl diester phosphodiesterase